MDEYKGTPNAISLMCSEKIHEPVVFVSHATKSPVNDNVWRYVITDDRMSYTHTFGFDKPPVGEYVRVDKYYASPSTKFPTLLALVRITTVNPDDIGHG